MGGYSIDESNAWGAWAGGTQRDKFNGLARDSRGLDVVDREYNVFSSAKYDMSALGQMKR